MKTAFFAYPSETPIVGEAVKGAIELTNGDSLSIKPWEKMKIVGLKLDDLIRDEIREANLLIADVTYPNFNVYYEMGFAAAVGRPVIPTVNIAVEKAAKHLSENDRYSSMTGHMISVVLKRSEDRLGHRFNTPSIQLFFLG